MVGGVSEGGGWSEWECMVYWSILVVLSHNILVHTGPFCQV